MKKEQTSKHAIFLIGVAIALLPLILVAINLLRIDMQSAITQNVNDQYILAKKDVKSLPMKFIVKIPDGWKIEEDYTYIDLVSSGGVINISRIGIGATGLADHLKSFDSHRNLEILKEEVQKVDDYDAILRIEKLNGGLVKQQKVIYIHINDWIYSLSTSSEELYDDLDQIAKSFRYTP